MSYSVHHSHISRDLRHPPELSKAERDRLRYRLKEQAAGHLDADERGLIIYDIDLEVGARTMMRAEAHRVCGLPPGSLDDCSLPTVVLREALAVLRGLPR